MADPRGGGGGRAPGMYPPLGPNSFIFIQFFWQNLCKIKIGAPLLGVGAPLGNPETATASNPISVRKIFSYTSIGLKVDSSDLGSYMLRESFFFWETLKDGSSQTFSALTCSPHGVKNNTFPHLLN